MTILGVEGQAQKTGDSPIRKSIGRHLSLMPYVVVPGNPLTKCIVLSEGDRGKRRQSY
jgi:hypothetical protein